MSEEFSLHDFTLLLKITNDPPATAPKILEVVPLKDTRSPFNSGTWVANVTLAGSLASCQVVWSNVNPEVLSSIEQLSVEFGSPDNAARSESGFEWGQKVQVAQHEVVTLSGSGHGSVTSGEYYFHGLGTYEAVVRIIWRVKDGPELESAALKRDDGPVRAARINPPLLSPSALDVRFVFLRDGGRELWANSTVLATVSPYFKIFETITPHIRSPGPPTPRLPTLPRTALAFDDSDDDDELADPPLLAPHTCTYPHYTIEITDFSYITYHAVLSWILSHHIAFRPRAATNSPTPTPKEHSSTLPLPASPKSVYRLTHLLEIPELQTLALEAIRSQVTVATVVADLFSETSGKYPAVLDVLCEFVGEHREEMREAGCWKEIARTVKKTAWGAEVLEKVL
ncbi:hypothetical protein RQP46_002299 [Phenoliferia psychrophenolica]